MSKESECWLEGSRGILEILDKLIVRENYLPEQIFNVDETCLFLKQIPARTFIHNETQSMPGFRTFKKGSAWRQCKLQIESNWHIETFIRYVKNDLMTRPLAPLTISVLSLLCWSGLMVGGSNYRLGLLIAIKTMRSWYNGCQEVVSNSLMVNSSEGRLVKFTWGD